MGKFNYRAATKFLDVAENDGKMNGLKKSYMKIIKTPRSIELGDQMDESSSRNLQRLSWVHVE